MWKWQSQEQKEDHLTSDIPLLWSYLLPDMLSDIPGPGESGGEGDGETQGPEETWGAGERGVQERSATAHTQYMGDCVIISTTKIRTL